MRGTRWLILLAIAAILGGVGLTYRLQKSALARHALPRPKALPLDLNASAKDWVWNQTAEGRPVVQVLAGEFSQSKDSSRIDLGHVRLKIFRKESGEFDLFQSEKARFTPNEGILYSEGEVEITLGLNEQGKSSRKLVSIHSSGVTVNVNTNMASTDQPASFVFDKGTGTSIGASYDPAAKELHLKHQVELHFQSAGPHSKPMKVEAGDVTYKEAEAKIWLRPWARLTRDTLVLETAAAVVIMEDGVIRRIDSVKAHGTDRYPQRTLDYSAAELWAELSETGAVTKITGQSGAHLLSTSDTTATTVTSDRVELEFAEDGKESTLARALAQGRGVVESRPVAVAGRPMPETHVLRSEIIEMKMRPGGKEIETLETQTPGVLEFLPNRPIQRHRTLTGERLSMGYGARNTIQWFRAANVETRSDPTEEERKRNRTTAVTRSKGMQAEFTPGTGQLSKIEQWDDFGYEEGDRRARAVHATMDQGANKVLLDKAARMWDPTGSTAADRIEMDQRSGGDFTAAGNVTSSRLPDKKKNSSEMLSGDEPLQAVASKMTSSNRNRQVVYEGNAVLWQGANRIQADRVQIDRDKRTLAATGHVITRFEEQPASQPRAGGGNAPPAAPPGPPVFTVVVADGLVYTEADRQARYSGGAHMTRPGLDVKGAEIRSFLAEQGAASRVQKAFADGAVEIAQSGPGRSRNAKGEHAEYYSGEEKIILRGGSAVLVDSLRGSAVHGAELTYFANDDRLLVNGTPEQPVKTSIRRKKP